METALHKLYENSKPNKEANGMPAIDSAKAYLNKYIKKSNVDGAIDERLFGQIEHFLQSAFQHYLSLGFSPERIAGLVDMQKIRAFYEKKALLEWYELETAAKLYPLSMSGDNMAVFRFSVYLKNPVIPEILQMALLLTLPNFPRFATCIKPGFFWHYLERNSFITTVTKDASLTCKNLDISRPNAQLYRVKFYQNRISVDFFHVLTDGKGASRFLLELVACYLQLIKCEKYTGSEKDKPSFEDGFELVDKTKPSNMGMDGLAVQIDGTREEQCVIQIEMQAPEILSAAKAHRTTVTTFLLCAMMHACKAAMKWNVMATNREIRLQVPVDMRRYYKSDTARNFSSYCVVKMHPDKIVSFEQTLKEIGRQLESMTKKEALDAGVCLTLEAAKKLKYVPLGFKKIGTALAYRSVGEGVFTTTLSNIGIIKVPDELREEIVGIDATLGAPAKNKVNCVVATYGEKTVFSITKIVPHTIFEETLIQILQQNKITLAVRGEKEE